MRNRCQSGRPLRVNSRNPKTHAEWMEGKKVGRELRKQVYVYDNGHSWSGRGEGHWRRV